MKKLRAGVLCLLMVAGLWGCLEAEPEETSTATTTQATTTLTTATQSTTTEPWVAPTPVPEGYSFTECYAKTPAHFFVLTENVELRRAEGSTLIRVQLNNLDKRTVISLPETYKGYAIEFRAICGVTPDGVYVQGVSYEGDGSDRKCYTDVIYCISLDGSETELVETGSEGNRIVSAWLNAASNSLLIFREQEVTALRLDTGKRDAIYHLITQEYSFERWYAVEEGIALSYYPHWYFIDARNQMEKNTFSQEKIDELEGRRKAPTNEAEAALRENELVRSFATCAGWVYYVEEEMRGIDARVDFYRMRPDGTNKTLLQEKTNIGSLEAINGKLFAIFREPILGASKDFNTIYLCRLDSNGRIVKTILESGDGYSSWMHMYRLGDMILLCNDYYYSALFTALYNPATEKLFTGI